MKNNLQLTGISSGRLVRDWRFSLSVVATLALCIGANVTLFSVIEALVFRPLRLPRPGQLMLVANSYPNAGLELTGASVPDYYDRSEKISAFQDVGLFISYHPILDIGGVPERVLGTIATPSILPLLGAETAQGRLFTEEEGILGSEEVVILEYGLWRSLYGGDPGAVGSDLLVSGIPHTIVGVLSKDFRFMDRGNRLWVSAAFSESQRSDARRHSNPWTMIARLRDGASPEAAQSQIDALNVTNLERFPQFRKILEEAEFHTQVIPFTRHLSQGLRSPLYLLLTGVLFILLIGCLNLSNLSLVRADVHARETLIRRALGASQGSIALATFQESLILAGLGGALGLALGWLVLRLLESVLNQYNQAGLITIGIPGFLWTALLAAVSAVLLSALPILYFLRTRSFDLLRQDGRAGETGRGSRWLRKGLVVAQIGLALVLLIGAAIMLTNFSRKAAAERGFNPASVFTGSISLPGQRFETGSSRAVFMTTLLKRISNLPGVMSSGAASRIPLGTPFSDSPTTKTILPVSNTIGDVSSLLSPNLSVVVPGYFKTLEIPIERGRTFSEVDRSDSQPVIIVDRRLARHFWGSEDPIGKQLYFPSNPEDLSDPGPEEERMTLIGVAGPVQVDDTSSADPSSGTYYLPYSQMPVTSMTLAVKAAHSEGQLVAPIRRSIAEEDSQMPLYDVRSMKDRVQSHLVKDRLPAMLAGTFSLLALLLASLGLYGTSAYLISKRRREIGIRLAVGANRSQIVRMVLVETLSILALGLALGLAGSLGLRVLLGSQIHGLQAIPPTLPIAAGAILTATSLAACWLPARRATLVDPMDVLGQE